jgi:hypothetical protein
MGTAKDRAKLGAARDIGRIGKRISGSIQKPPPEHGLQPPQSTKPLPQAGRAKDSPGRIGPDDPNAYLVWGRRVDGEMIKRAVEQTSEHLHDGMREHEYMVYEPRPLWRTVTFGTLGVLLLFGQIGMPRIDAALGGVFGAGLGYLRLAMMIAGGYCVFFAWPRYRHRGISDEEEEQRRKMKAEFSRKFRR